MRDSVGFLDHLHSAPAARAMTDLPLQPWCDPPAFANHGSLRSSDQAVEIPPGGEKFDFALKIGAVTEAS
ncbi:hypothetical protein BHE97_17715 [Aeromicrobium sp. PE09-221]|uniref:hypothetical protein n=1 Tax=Aeromicrobium sp. PE09-221 TaxID=1898043 RepID=UPI000B3EC019|nr:hypothetical protein [Aeromicrobium sp. PE09-221]OUZ07336.1 hypothetical protein BHE97_17715 [Aeromicrobium sp. PE09-221]